ncbi:hypothetical protein H7I77_21575 [Mycolicibacterium novocastrense]|uniref:Deazaflavin-dependent nitroreductase family protein n=1 Tax=Mycolicibacterium novocastrense TaxID=59813 RepID=A0AAW5SQA0_MYCNV|nr:hypothetical protein [Mycolicibacterium novocastrense]MCV7025908.1 hypothetical protein [Mycolicibacterium novocastrense]GAT08385.1 uncharacterized protein RMCN_1518 [Mycolicibacterium novocastrense]
MTDQIPAVSTGHPPGALMRFLNPSLRFLLRTPLAGPLGNQFMVLNFRGRKSGRQFSIPVTAHHIDGGLYAIANTVWKNNFRDGADAEVVHRGTARKMRGDLITDPGVVADLAQRLAQSYGPRRAQTTMGLKFRDGGIPSVEDFAEAVRREGIAAVRFSPA